MFIRFRYFKLNCVLEKKNLIKIPPTTKKKEVNSIFRLEKIYVIQIQPTTKSFIKIPPTTKKKRSQ